MRAAYFLAGLVSAAAAASTITLTKTTDVTVTLCSPTATNCGLQATKTNAEWENVTQAPAPAPTPTDVECTDDDFEWEEWSSANGASCPSYTATAPPTWFSNLPPADFSSIAAKWSTGPPADWCYYSYTSTSIKTSAAPYPTGGVITSAAGTGGYKPTYTSAMPTYTGAANSNAGSMVLVGVAAAAALVLA